MIPSFYYFVYFATEGGWSDNGDTFVIKNTEKFAKEIIPKWYKHNNISSFVRQLHFCKKSSTLPSPF